MPPLGESGMYTNKIHYLRKYLLDELVTKKFAMDFMEPVDTAVLQVPNYYNIIKRPMDVGTIIKRVQNRYYHRVDNLISDFRLVISNCFTFNRPGDVVYRNCQKLEKFFHRILNKMPKGEEKPSTKDPHASGKQQSVEKSNEVIQRLCRDMTRKLHAAISREDDKDICKYFYVKLDLLSQKIDRHYFKTIEEFHFEVNSIFMTFDTQVKLLYDAYHKYCDHDPNIKCEKCSVEQEDAEESDEQSDSGITLDKEDIADIMIALKKAENCVDLCMKSYSKEKVNRARDLINSFTAAADRLKIKLKLKHNDQVEDQSETEEEEQKPEQDNEEEAEEESEDEDSEQETEEEQGEGQVEEQEMEQDEDEEGTESEDNEQTAQEQEEVAKKQQVQSVQQYLGQCYSNSLKDEKQQQQQAMNANYDKEYCKQRQTNKGDVMAQAPPAYYMDPHNYNAKQFDISSDQQQQREADVAIAPKDGPAIPPESTLWSDLQMSSSSSDDSDKD